MGGNILFGGGALGMAAYSRGRGWGWRVCPEMLQLVAWAWGMKPLVLMGPGRLGCKGPPLLLVLAASQRPWPCRSGGPQRCCKLLLSPPPAHASTQKEHVHASSPTAAPATSAKHALRARCRPGKHTPPCPSPHPRTQSGVPKPGKKGISLEPADWGAVCAAFGHISAALAARDMAYVLDLTKK